MNRILAFTLLLLFLLVGCTAMPQETKEKITVEGQQTAIFAGGCFWCMEAPFESEPGVLDVISGYIGGDASSANYQDVSSGKTQHREGIQVTYDPKTVSYERLVELYFWQIDPSDPEGQFADKGFQYTTAIYYFNNEQKEIALNAIRVIDDSKKFETPVVTQVIPTQTFYAAEEYHQDYYLKQSARYETYSTLSGRKGFIKKFWSKE